MRYLAAIFWILVAAIVIVFAVLNSHSVAINFYVTTINFYLPLLLLLTLAIGALLGILAMLPVLFRSKGAHRRCKQRIRTMEQELNNLRTIPVKDTH